jgi:hypothetical protein
MDRSCLVFGIVIAVFAGVLHGCSGDSSTGGGAPSADESPPSAVQNIGLSLTGDGQGVVVEWTAPSDDSLAERVSAYEIEVEYTDGFAPPEFWTTATRLADPPSPGAPGTAESYLIVEPRRARDLYLGIVAVDEAGNHSLPSGPFMIQVPGYRFSAVCVNAFTRSPVEGLEATVSTGKTFNYTTDSAGRIVHDGELDGGVTYLEVRMGSSSTPYHSMSQSFVLESDSVHTFLMIPVEPVNAEGVPNLLTLFNDLQETVTPAPSSDGDGLASGAAAPRVLTQWRHRPVKCYIPAFVNVNGVDYQDQARLATARWMDKTGEPLFELVDSPPDTGITVAYKPRSQMGSTIGITTHAFGGDGALLRDDLWVVDDAAASAASRIYLIFLHEFGHTIPLGHFNDRSFIMYQGQPLPGDISDDEVRIVQLHEALPFGIDMSIYDENSPAP